MTTKKLYVADIDPIELNMRIQMGLIDPETVEEIEMDDEDASLTREDGPFEFDPVPLIDNVF